MLSSREYKKRQLRQKAWLYKAVFNGKFSLLLVIFLCSSFMVQPINQAMASDEIPENTPPTASDVKPQEEPVDEEVSPSDESQPSETPTNPTENSDNETTDASDATTTPEVNIETPPDNATSTASDSNDETNNDVISTEATTTTVIDGEEVESQRVQTADGEVLKIESLVTNENYYQFNKNSCIEVGNGVFNCTSRKDVDSNQDSVVYTELDNGGDKEIYLKTSRGIEKKITDNDFEDSEPNYDPASMRIVWQRGIEGRTQIMMYDILEDKETQLTFSKTNNMQPKVSELGIVWQAWDNSDWEIMYFDGVHTTQVTDNDVQDVAPVIQDGYVLWNVLGGNTQQARVYSIATKETVSIKGYEGGSIKNPRFVLVYDTELGNGDVITQTFDPSTGLSKPVAAKPAPSPVDIPNSDPTGEIRALIQGKTQKDDKEIKLLESHSSSTNNSTVSDGATLDLHATSSSSDAIITPAAQVSPDFELTEYDLVIPEGAFSEALANTEDIEE